MGENNLPAHPTLLTTININNSSSLPDTPNPDITPSQPIVTNNINVNNNSTNRIINSNHQTRQITTISNTNNNNNLIRNTNFTSFNLTDKTEDKFLDEINSFYNEILKKHELIGKKHLINFFLNY